LKNNSSNSIIKTENLSIGYSKKNEKINVMDNINLDLPKGKMICILGKNGIGKSTLLKTLTKVLSKLSGNIMIDQNNLENYTSIDLAKKMSLVLTENIPDSNLTVYELIALGRQPYTNWLGTLTKNDRQSINFAIQRTQIYDLIKKKYFEISDGQLQKVMIARALAQNTELIVLDEPTSHLDIHNKIEIFKLLKSLSTKYNKTIIISTHEIHLALQLSDELVLMDNKAVKTGNTEELINNNSIAKLFNSENITFDSKSKQFLIHDD
jgi:iron complex transport system ATP-binding protein